MKIQFKHHFFLSMHSITLVYTALYYAVSNGHIDIVKLILSHKRIDINILKILIKFVFFKILFYIILMTFCIII